MINDACTLDAVPLLSRLIKAHLDVSCALFPPSPSHPPALSRSEQVRLLVEQVSFEKLEAVLRQVPVDDKVSADVHRVLRAVPP